ncbi:hypothetical protein ABII15_13990 [Streptomyces sp. HUAS MG91]|uniref:Aromatic ring-opening dioxygenase LigA n=1 Tax=Streptomyces tabacisoli TaxID=3156398 RepID=A0AAU8IS49_9ACTN
MIPGTAVLSIDALTVAVEESPRYRDAAGAQAADGMSGMFGGWEAAGDDPDGGLLAGYLASVAEYSGRPVDRLRMLTARADGEDVVETALRALGPPPGPQPFVLVHSGADRDTLGAALPRLVHEMGWEVTEDMGLTHLGDLGGAAVVDLVSWWADPRAGATAVVLDQPLFALADAVPERLTAVGLRFGAGDGPLRVLARGEGGPVPESDHVFSGPGACGGWPELHRALQHDEPRPDDRILVRCGAGEHHAWVLLSRAAGTPWEL